MPAKSPLVLGTTLLLVVGAQLAVGPSGAVADAVTDATGPTTSVTVLLSSPHPTALRRLARRHGLGRAERRRRLAPLLPTASTRDRVVSRLRAHGFTVTGRSTWAVTADAPASAVRATLGTMTASGELSGAYILGAGVVSVTTAASEPDLHPLTSSTATTGADYRAAYAVPGGSASAGQNDATSTVATIQLSGWSSTDLTYYATHVLGVSDPVASGQYSQALVDSGPTDTDGSGEVDLDQESILATAPSARQRAYLAPNTTAGFVDAYAQVASEAAARHTTAVSVSWGDCESAWTSGEFTAMEQVLASVNAAGVTVFAATGDDGIYDCDADPDPSLPPVGVDYPASSPYVVAVGGTKLTSTSSPHTTNSGSNWVETAWSCTNRSTCYTDGGSGGGASSQFSRPLWQTGLSGVYAASSARLVPDIAAIGDPDTGFDVYEANGSVVTAGGTSLASPVAAAGFANALDDAGISSHVGDIHPALYAAASGSGYSQAFRDVTSGQNGLASSAGSNPSVYAATGYDTVTGLGAPYWAAIVPAVVTPTPSPPAPPSTGAVATGPPPAATATSRVVAVTHRGRRHRVLAQWLTRDPSGVWADTAVILRDATTGAVLGGYHGFSGSHTVMVRARHKISVVVSVSSTNGQVRSTTVRLPHA